MRGGIPFTADARGGYRNFQSLLVNLDLGPSELNWDIFGWRKEYGTPAKGRISLKFEEDDILVEDVALIGEDFNVVGEGRADYTGRIEKPRSQTFSIGGSG